MTSAKPPRAVLDDPDDIKFLALAREAATDALVTGDRDLLAVQPAVRFTTILTPSAFAAWLDAV